MAQVFRWCSFYYKMNGSYFLILFIKVCNSFAHKNISSEYFRQLNVKAHILKGTPFRFLIFEENMISSASTSTLA